MLFSNNHRPSIFLKNILLAKSDIIVKWLMLMPELPKKHPKAINIFFRVDCLRYLLSCFQRFRGAPYTYIAILIESACIFVKGAKLKVSDSNSLCLFWAAIRLKFNKNVVS